jgi:aspartate/methionine/tyrosine aminotransferase
MADIAKAHVYNTACPVGISQTAVAMALESNSDNLQCYIDEWQSRRDFIVDALKDKYAIIPAAGGWSMLLDVGRLGLGSADASRRLLKAGKVAATYMRDWGRLNSDQFVRIVFSNEPLGRLRDIRSRFDRALL